MLPSHAALLNKSPGKVGRIAGLLWVLDYVTDKTGGDEVGVQFVQQAIQLVEHLDRYAMQFNVEANQTAKEKCMWRLHRNAGKTKAWIPQRTLRNNCSPAEKERFDAAEMQEMLQELAKAGYGEVRLVPAVAWTIGSSSPRRERGRCEGRWGSRVRTAGPHAFSGNEGRRELTLLLPLLRSRPRPGSS